MCARHHGIILLQYLLWSAPSQAVAATASTRVAAGTFASCPSEQKMLRLRADCVIKCKTRSHKVSQSHSSYCLASSRMCPHKLTLCSDVASEVPQGVCEPLWWQTQSSRKPSESQMAFRCGRMCFGCAGYDKGRGLQPVVSNCRPQLL